MNRRISLLTQAVMLLGVLPDRDPTPSIESMRPEPLRDFPQPNDLIAMQQQIAELRGVQYEVVGPGLVAPRIDPKPAKRSHAPRDRVAQRAAKKSKAARKRRTGR